MARSGSLPAWCAPWRRWSLRARLLSIMIVPLVYMFVTFIGYLYASGITEVDDELAERGPLVAKVLADSSEYHLAMGRLGELRQGVERVVQADRGIYQVEVLDATRKGVLTVPAKAAGKPDTHPHEAPIVRRLVWVNPQGQPAVQGGFSTETVGYVRVTMSPTAAMRRHVNRFTVALLVAGLGLLACAALAWQFARHFNDSLQSTLRALRAADAEKRVLLRKVNSAVEEERRSIALEIHDELNATLIAVRLEAQRIAALAQRFPVAREAVRGDTAMNDSAQDGRSQDGPVQDEPAAEIARRAQGITKLALGLYNSGRALVRRLRPEVLELLGLQGAIEEMVRQHDSVGQGCRYRFQAEGEFSKLDHAVAISAYRIVQEALSNVAKHARATDVAVTLVREAGIPGDRLCITVADNGKGFDPAQVAGGIGIAGMRERVAAYAGTFDVASMPGAGTVITIRLPTAVSAGAP